MNSQYDAATAQTIGNRFLLTPGLAEFPERVLLASCGGAMGNDDCYVRIALTAVGMQPSDLYATRDLLVDRLRGALQPAVPGETDPGFEDASDEDYANQNPWIHMVSIEPNLNTREGEIVVAINNPSFMGSGSTDAIMNIVSGILAPVARENSRVLIVLTGDQCCVPLDFEVDDMFRRWMTLALPRTLKYIRPRLASITHDDDPLRYRANYLEAVLKLALDRHEFVQTVSVRATADGLRIDVNFGDRNYPSASNLNIVQAAITRAVHQHAFLDTGLFTSLVLVPAYSHSDPDGDYDEDRGFLGENREY